MTGDHVRRLGAAAVGATLLVALLGACGGKERNYQIPKSLCGVPVLDEHIVEDVLPGGDEIDPRPASTGDIPQHLYCDIHIDNKVQIGIEGTWRPAGFTAKDSAVDHLQYGAPSTDHGRYVYWEDGATTAFPCANTKQKSGAFSVYVNAPRADGDMGEKMRRFVASYAQAWKTRLPCGS
ncbi:hypothetical protein [Streptomyces sp. NPDC050560]|uniref:hypothetical protein n=1 Tax=Streptomyces sp. NPDC050560 TaxID=3365630 RepID=UPI0037B8BDD9